MIYMGSPANFAKVDGRVWRGARPDAAQAAWLVDQGVRTFLDLEWEQSDEALIQAIDGANRLGVVYMRLRDFEPLPWFAPSIADGDLVITLAAIRRAFAVDESKRKNAFGLQIMPIVYVHCRSGENRTGVVVAGYRIIERNDSLPVVLAEFNDYRGFWAWGDMHYIRTLAERRDALLRRIAIVANRPQ